MAVLMKAFSYLKSNVLKKVVALVLLAYFFWLMLQIVLQYIPYHTDVGFLRIKQQYLGIDIWRWAFFIHVYSSLFTLIAGFTQFSNRLLKSAPRTHRSLGYVYVIFVLALSGPSGLIISFYANGGWISAAGFLVLSTLWMYFTTIALIKVKQKRFVEHRQFMMRSYALTLSAITLRVWKFVITNLFDLPPMDVYAMVAWLGFGVNLIVAEWWIRRADSNKHFAVTS
jgi:hypothetical protein